MNEEKTVKMFKPTDLRSPCTIGPEFVCECTINLSEEFDKVGCS